MLRVIARLLIGLAIVAVIIGIALAVFRYVVVPRSFPTEDGSIRLDGLDGPVDVYRDSLGIPHIYASTEHDLLMAQGFVQAQDRFWQMEFQRRIGMGRLSEILGESALDQDRFIRTVGWHRIAALEAEMLEGRDQALLEAYAEGVNAYLGSHSGAKGLEFTVLGLTGVKFEPEPWTPLDTLTWGKVMAWDLGGSRRVELTRAQIAAKLGTPAINVLMPPYNPEYPTIVAHPLSEASLDSIPDAAYSTLMGEAFLGIGSNSFAVSGDRTSTGTALLANDPHLSIQMPSIWHEIGLHCQPVGPECGFNVVGGSLLGVPGVVIGHNDRIAWGFTNLGPDVVDFFIEKQNPENPNQYEYQGEWLDMQIIREQIQVDGWDEPEIVDVRITRHGPIINDVAGGTEDDWIYGWEPLAFSWTALEPGTIFKAILQLNLAQDWDEFREALRFFDTPSQNIIYADVDGNIGYQAPGRIPIRANGDGSMPVPGWTGEFEWIDTIPYEELPSVYNPQSGYIATANNAVVGPEYPYFISIDWNEGYRARRIIELLEADDSISMVDLQAIQRDMSPLYAQDILHHILAVRPDDLRLSQAQDLLRSWDGRADRDSAGAALFEAFRVEIIDTTFEDELGAQLLEQSRGHLMVAVSNLMSDPAAPWFDDIHTVEVEDRDDAIQQALERAVDFLSETLGSNMNEWRWGDLHTATFENQSLGQSGIAPIEWIFNRGPVETDGAIGAVNNIGYSLNDPFAVSFLPSYRQIVDLGDLNQSLSIHTTGQSGHPFHEHYDDMIDLWRNAQYHSMLWTRQQVEAAAAAHLVLEP
jgi:penicillin amidase